MSIDRKNFFNEEIIELVLNNTFYRKEIFTGPHSQIVLMSVPAGETIDREIHMHIDQILFFVQGKGQAILNDIKSDILPYHLVFVPAGVQHEFRNTGQEDLKLFTIYSPAHHQAGIVQEIKHEKHE